MKISQLTLVVKRVFWVWFWHIVAIVAVFAFGGLPSLYIKKIVERFEVHRPVKMSDVSFVRLGDRQLAGDELQTIVDAFNQSAFLRLRDVRMAAAAEHPVIEIGLVNGEVISVFRDGREIGVVRGLQGKTKAYQVHSPLLSTWVTGQAG